MHLIRISTIEIYDLETGALFDYEFKTNVFYNGEPGHYISRKNAGNDNYSPVASGNAAQRLWAYLESLLKFDATKAQDAPQLKEDGKARVKWTDEEDHEDAPWLTVGMIGTVIEITPSARVLEMAFEGHREQVALLIDQVEPVN